MKLYRARGSVCVSPGILDTNVIVAPNSPRLLAKARIVPAITPGRDRGSVIVKKTFMLFAPKVRAAASNPLSMESNERRTALTISGKAITADAIAAPFHENAMVISKV